MILQILKNKLCATASDGTVMKFSFPAVAVSVNGERIEAATPVGEVKRSGRSFICCYLDRGIEFELKVTPGKGDWFFKELTLKSSSDLPTPDYVELECQKIPAGGMKRRGYMVSGALTGRPGAEEEGGGTHARMRLSCHG